MASIRKRGESWQAVVRKRGVYATDTFKVKARAVAWANQVEADIEAGRRGEVPNKPFSAVLERYRDEVSPTKRGHSVERHMIAGLLRDPISEVNLQRLDSTHFAKWRDNRALTVKPGTVLREMNLLSHACTVAVKEWKWLKENPLKGLRRPKQPAARDRRISQDEIERLLVALGNDYRTPAGRVGLAMLFAIETAMRQGEIASLTWEDITGNVARLSMTKNGSGRDVPLLKEALRILTMLPTPANRSEPVFGLKSRQIEYLFREARHRAMIEGLHFHDTRAEAITRLAALPNMNILRLAKISGHRDMRILQVYFRESASDMAKKLEG
jgi:integrase